MRQKLVILSLMMAGCTEVSAQSACFDFFRYEGHDARFTIPYDHSRQYINPVIAGFYPDPSVCRKGDTYYLVNSSFAFYPGVPVFRSHDLVDWQQIGHVLDRDSQLQLHHHHVSDGIFAPAISYNRRNHTFYMVTMNMGERKVFYVKSKKPESGWSDPFMLKAGGMDPAFFFDTDGKAYLVYTTFPKGGPSYPGEMSIRMNRFYVKADSVSTQSVELVRGGTTQSGSQPQWLEGPHVYHIGSYYYLMCAEGGTGDQHSEVIFRSRSLSGKWESCPVNPILTQRNLGARDNAVSSVGHADLIEAPDGGWWAVFLGCRPYEGDLYQTGRETFLLPVKWQDGWPVILESGKSLPTLVEKKDLSPSRQHDFVTGNFSYRDDFKEKKLDAGWICLRNPAPDFYSLTDSGLVLKAMPANLSQTESVSALFRRQQHAAFSVETKFKFHPLSDEQLAGFTLFQNETHHIVFGKTLLGGKSYIILERTTQQTVMKDSLIIPAQDVDLPVCLRIIGSGKSADFLCKIGNQSWQTIAAGVDVSNLSTHVAGGYTGVVIGLYATNRRYCSFKFTKLG